MFKKVLLLTKDGDYVASDNFPKFNEPPAVLIWGERFFTYDTTDDEDVDVYVEAFGDKCDYLNHDELLQLERDGFVRINVRINRAV